MNNKQKKKLVKNDYNAIAKLYAREDKNINFYAPHIDKFLNLVNGVLILDACCGDGEFSNYIANQNKNVIGVDISIEMIKIAREKYKEIQFENEDISKWNSNKIFNGIFCKDALFHLPDEEIDIVLNKFYKMLDSKGKLLLILDIPKETGEKIYVEPLNSKFFLYYNYLSIDKTKQFLINHNFKIDEIIIHNESDYEYAKGIMFIYVSK